MFKLKIMFYLCLNYKIKYKCKIKWIEKRKKEKNIKLKKKL